NRIIFNLLIYFTVKLLHLVVVLQSHGYDTVPSHIHKYPFKDTKYFHGGYCVQKYGSQYIEHVVDAIQI
ncbi:20352_t:CDS:1, partial [Gigaspora rosea]